MSATSDPPRWTSSDSAAPAPLRALLGHAQADVATDAELSVLEARLAPLIGTGVSGAPSVAKPLAGAPATAATAVKVGALVAAVAGVGTAWVVLSGPTHTAATPPAPPAAIAAPAPAAPAAPTADLGAPPSEPTAPPVDAPRPSPPSEGANSPSRRPNPEATVSEADLLGQAQVALRSDPGKALSLAEKHRSAFPHGMLVQEREVLAIEALTRLGRSSQAKARAAAFLDAYPRSAYRSKVQGLVPGQ
jgi:hypothetical protein